MKPSNTGRLIADILPDTLAYSWSRTKINPDLLLAINDVSYQPFVVFPASYASAERQFKHKPLAQGKLPLFIMLDGTWRQARRMFHKSPWLNQFPVMSVNVTTPSAYCLREAHASGQHCTAEVAIALLTQAGDLNAAQALSHHFLLFRDRYLAGKPLRHA